MKKGTRADSISLEYRIICKDGRRIWLNDIRTLEYSENGNIFRVNGVASDITDRIKSEDGKLNRLRRVQKQQSTIVEMATMHSMINGDFLNAVKQITESSAKALNIDRSSVWLLNDDRQQLECIDLYEKSSDKHSAGQLLQSKDFPNYFKAIENGIAVDAYDAQNDPRTCEFATDYLIPLGITSMLDAGIRVSGRTIGVVCQEHIGEMIRWSVDKVTFTSAVADQVAQAYSNSERKKSDKLLRNSEKKYRNLVENISDGVLILDNDLEILYANQSSHKIFGYDKNELLGK